MPHYTVEPNRGASGYEVVGTHFQYGTYYDPDHAGAVACLLNCGFSYHKAARLTLDPAPPSGMQRITQ